ncbi:hypothetical protein BY996DRAFT_8401223 [Phakopsora pachyrhizi]|nr:hypothetical protein BY996DRAFT_8401223 [Phakopsora pachyrhizi]
MPPVVEAPIGPYVSPLFDRRAKPGWLKVFGMGAVRANTVAQTTLKETLNKPVTTNNIPSNKQMNPSINHGPVKTLHSIKNIDNDKINHNNPHIQSDRLIRKGLAEVWLWNSEMKVGEYYYLRKKSSTSSSKGLISRYSGWVTDGSPGHHPPSKEQMASKLLEKFKNLQGYKWYWFKDRWLLFSLHNI